MEITGDLNCSKMECGSSAYRMLVLKSTFIVQDLMNSLHTAKRSLEESVIRLNQLSGFLDEMEQARSPDSISSVPYEEEDGELPLDLSIKREGDGYLPLIP